MVAQRGTPSVLLTYMSTALCLLQSYSPPPPPPANAVTGKAPGDGSSTCCLQLGIQGTPAVKHASHPPLCNNQQYCTP